MRTAAGAKPFPPRLRSIGTASLHFLVCWLVLLGNSALVARQISVSPNAAGESVLAKAIQAAADGDVLVVSKGLYRETIEVTKRLAIIGQEGAVIDPSTPFAPAWEAAPDIGRGVYRAVSERKPQALLLDGKVLAELSERRVQEPGKWFWKDLLASGPPLGGFHFIRAIWLYHSKEKAIYLHLAEDAIPSGLKWSVLWSAAPVVAFRVASGASVQNFTIAHGFTGVAMLGGAEGCTVSGCTIGPWERTGVLVSGGASRCLVESNQVFRGAYEEWSPADTSKARYEVWQIHKLAGFYDRVGIALVRAGTDNRIHANHVYETFDGIDIGDSTVESLDKPLTHPEDGKGTWIWDNVIERTRDSGMELGVGCIDVRVHHNILRLTHGGLRFKLPRIGPVFIYRNLLLDGAPFNIWYSMDDSPAEGYIYHNTIVGGRAGLIYSSFESGHQIGAPGWRYWNNLVAAEQGFFRNSNVNAPINFIADYNLVVGGGQPWPKDKTKDMHSKYVTESPLASDARPKPGSPAIDAGLDLSTAFHGGPLPGCEPGYFKGKAPDIGAYEVE